MTKIYKTLFLFSAMLMLTSCNQQPKKEEVYCGLAMSGFEVIDAKSMAAKFTYSPEDKVLLNTVTKEVLELYPKKDAEVYFFQKDDKNIGIYIVGPDDNKLVEQVSCHLLKSQLEGLPKNRKVVFYTNEHNNLVAAVKSK